MKINIPRDLLMSLNDRTVWQGSLRQKKTLCELGKVHGLNSGIKLDRARLTVLIHWPDNRRRDRHNYTPTIKHLIDGMVDAGVLPDDDDDHLDGPILQTARFEPCDKRFAATMEFIFQAVTA